VKAGANKKQGRPKTRINTAIEAESKYGIATTFAFQDLEIIVMATTFTKIV
jgi:hypothetical protein